MTPTRTKALAALRGGRVAVLLADGAVLAPDVIPPARVTAAVRSSREERTVPYFVDFAGGVWTCTCRAGVAPCAHVAAVQLATGHPSEAAKQAAA